MSIRTTGKIPSNKSQSYQTLYMILTLHYTQIYRNYYTRLAPSLQITFNFFFVDSSDFSINLLITFLVRVCNRVCCFLPTFPPYTVFISFCVLFFALIVRSYIPLSVNISSLIFHLSFSISPIIFLFWLFLLFSSTILANLFFCSAYM